MGEKRGRETYPGGGGNGNTKGEREKGRRHDTKGKT